MLKFLSEHTKDLMNWMIWMNIFKMKLMSLNPKISKLLTAMKKVVLMITTPVAEEIYHKTLIFTSSNLIDMFKWKNPKERRNKQIQTIH